MSALKNFPQGQASRGELRRHAAMMPAEAAAEIARLRALVDEARGALRDAIFELAALHPGNVRLVRYKATLAKLERQDTCPERGG